MTKRFSVNIPDKNVWINDLVISLDFWMKLNPDFQMPAQDPHYDNGLPWLHWHYIINSEDFECMHALQTKKSEKHLLTPDKQCEEWIANYENYKEAWEIYQKELKIIPPVNVPESEVVSDSKKTKVKR